MANNLLKSKIFLFFLQSFLSNFTPTFFFFPGIMSLIIFSVLGVVFAFLGLGAFILSLICLLPVNIYNAILSSIKLSHAIPLLNKTMLPLVFFGGNIVVALVSVALFYMITRKRQQAKDIMNGKTDNVRRGTTPSNQISNHNVFSHHKHSLMNGYTYTYVAVAVVWALVGSFLLFTLVSNHTENVNDGDKEGISEEDKQLMLIIEAIRAQVSHLWINILTLAVAACTMGFASLFFILGRKRNHPETKYLLTSDV
ncbi:unnamed protein product [Mucor hiemalis]